MTEFDRRLDDIGTKLWLLTRLLNAPKECSYETFSSLRDELYAHGNWFKEEAMNAAKRGERVPVFERLAMAFGNGTIDLDWIPRDYLIGITKIKGAIVDETK